MGRFPIAVRLEALGQPIRQAIESAARLGAAGIQFDAVGDLAPESLSETGRRQLAHLVRSHGMRIVGLGCPTRRGFDEPDRLDGRIERARRTLTLAFELRAPVVINFAGPIPEDPASKQAHTYRDALRVVGRHAEKVGARLAMQTAGDAAEGLATFLSELASPGLAVTYCPANFVPRGQDAIAAAVSLQDWIAAVQCKDLVRTASTLSGVREVPLGEGEIPYGRILAALEEIDYRGDLIIDRESATRPIDEVAAAIEKLKTL